MVGTGDCVKVVDFGLAKPVAAAAADETAEALTLQGQAIGTTPYMSPEQAAGRAVDGRSDLFSLGVVLYEMLAGRRPFEGDSVAGTLAAILRDDPAPIGGITPEAEGVLGRCLRKDRAERFRSAAELRGVVLQCLAPRAGSGNAAVAAPGSPCIAVLPFTRMTGSAADDYLCEGLAEEIINALTAIPGLKVIARTSAFAVARMGLDITEAGAKLGAGHILEGSVRREGVQYACRRNWCAHRTGATSGASATTGT